MLKTVPRHPLPLLFQSKNMVIGLVFLVLFVFAVVPFLLLLFQSVWDTGNHQLTWEYYREIFNQSANAKAILNTLMVSLGTMIFTIILGVPLGWLVSRTDLPGRHWFRTLFMVPYIIPPYVGAIAWIQLLNPRVGYVNTWFKQLFSTEQALFNIYSIPGMIWVLGLFFYPFVFMATHTALDNMDSSLEETARMSGASNWRVLKDITFPLILPAIVSGAFLALVATAASFGVPAMIGRNQIFVLTTMIYKYVNLGTLDGPRLAIALSVILMFGAAAILVFNALYMRKRKYVLLTGKSTHKHLTHLKKWKWPMFIGVLMLFFCITMLPLGTIFMTSLLKTWGQGFGFDNLSIANYATLIFKRESTRQAIINSLTLAVATATIAIALGAMIAYIKVKTAVKGRHLLDFLAAMPYATPGTIVAIGIILAFTGRFGLNLHNTFSILLVAYAVKFLSFGVRTVAASLEQMDNSLEEAGFMSGAGWLKTLQTIVIPILKPSLIAGWFLVFMPAFSELTMSILLFGPKTQTMGTILFELQTYEAPPLAATLGCLIVAIVLSANLILKKATGGKYGI